MRHNAAMTNRIAIALGILIAAFIIIDALAFGGHAPLFLARKGLEFIDWIAFWR
jgi:hypothetical protein